MKKSGFTFVELMVAIVIGAFVTVTAVAAMRGIVAGSQTHQHLTELNDEMRYACSLIKQDLNNMYRHAEFKNAKFELMYLDSDEGMSTQSLILYTVSRKKTRPLQPEGDVYEVQYSIDQNAELGRSVLMRRCCAVAPGIEVGEDVERAGMLVPLAENITGLFIRCFSGTEWVDEWDEEKGRFPELVEVALIATDGQNSQKTLRRSFYTSLARMKTDETDEGQSGEDDADGEQDYNSYMDDDFSDMSQDEGGSE